MPPKDRNLLSFFYSKLVSLCLQSLSCTRGWIMKLFIKLFQIINEMIANCSQIIQTKRDYIKQVNNCKPAQFQTNSSNVREKKEKDICNTHRLLSHCSSTSTPSLIWSHCQNFSVISLNCCILHIVLNGLQS